MATTTTITLTDDIDGKSKAEETISFALDGVSYEIDLSKSNAAALRKSLAEFVAAGRSIKPIRSNSAVHRSSGQGAKLVSNKLELFQIRSWAQSNGFAVGDRGRLSSTVREAYAAANG